MISLLWNNAFSSNHKCWNNLIKGRVYLDTIDRQTSVLSQIIYAKNLFCNGREKTVALLRLLQVRLAERWGAKAVILFSDPDMVTNGDIDGVYPDDWWLPPSGTERGTLLIGEGDPLTADYPSIGK